MVIDALYVLWKKVKTRLRAKDLEVLESVAAMFIKSAEQQGIKGELLRTGAAKKDYVVQSVHKYLLSIGINIDVSVIADAVEAGVLEATSQYKPKYP